jgi:hypothetical protein
MYISHKYPCTLFHSLLTQVSKHISKGLYLILLVTQLLSYTETCENLILGNHSLNIVIFFCLTIKTLSYNDVRSETDENMD